jgi:hypothetical protein
MDNQNREKLKEFLHIANALLESMNASVHGDGENIWKYSSYWHFARKCDRLVEEVSKVISVSNIIDRYNLKNLPTLGDTVLPQQQAYFDDVHANLSILKAYLETILDLKTDEISELKHFLQSTLRKAIFVVPEKEITVQDAIEQLLLGRGLTKGIDYDRETGRVKISIKEVVPDFIFPHLGLALEVKLSKDKEKSRAIVDEINADIKAYSKKYSSLLFVVYDLGTIRDEVEFKQDLEATDGIAVIVIKH